ncbi:hypothetical protein Acr_28g0012470 [Actinidia rufa]|uniref:Uncharacterized protein n=1 Tax=Actinidia rufa TaxID=165716 RepID=A0A7J0HBS5_9ERIC|nr:hypothetical protein Acr_28g0012470 [Actinidia rufa]
MDIRNPDPETRPQSQIPPRRGRITIRVLTEICKPAVSIASKGIRLVRERGEDGGGLLNPNPTTPHETPSGYNTEDYPCDG